MQMFREVVKAESEELVIHLPKKFRKKKVEVIVFKLDFFLYIIYHLYLLVIANSIKIEILLSNVQITIIFSEGGIK